MRGRGALDWLVATTVDGGGTAKKRSRQQLLTTSSERPLTMALTMAPTNEISRESGVTPLPAL